MKISIAMATYNGAKYLQEQLDSLVNQTRQPDELVVCDDTSTDETVDILNRFAKTAPFQVKIFVNEKNLGYTQNFGRALSLCVGDLIFLSDQDDVWFPEKIATIENLAEQDDYTQIFMNDAELVHHDLSPTGLTKQGQIKSAGLPNSCFVMGCCMAIRRDFLKHLLPIPIEFTHDSWLSKLAEGLQRRTIISQSLQLYRRHGSNASVNMVNRTLRINKIDTMIDNLKKTVENIRGYDSHGIDTVIVYTRIIIQVLTKWRKETNDESLIAQIDEYKIAQKTLVKALEERITIRRMPLIRRVFYAATFYCRRGYQQFNGISSYVRDILA